MRGAGTGSRLASRYQQFSAVCLAATFVLVLMAVRMNPGVTPHIRIAIEGNVKTGPSTDGAFGEATYDPKKVRLGTFAYLVMGTGKIEDHWYQISQDETVVLWYLAWETDPSLTLRNDSLLHAFYSPQSTWASGRNILMQVALAAEERQGWLFEYVVFCDEDVRLDERANLTSVVPGAAHVPADARFRALLLRDRPARAGVELPYSYLDLWAIPLPCVRNCAYDAALDAYHRSALSQVLPYETRFDGDNWWMASETTSYRGAALLSPYCSTYREVVHNSFSNTHSGTYPQRKGFKARGAGAYMHCLGQKGVGERTWRNLYSFGFDRVTGDGENCTRQDSSVNYYALLTEEQKRIRTCSRNRVAATTTASP